MTATRKRLSPLARIRKLTREDAPLTEISAALLSFTAADDATRALRRRRYRTTQAEMDRELDRVAKGWDKQRLGRPRIAKA